MEDMEKTASLGSAEGAEGDENAPTLEDFGLTPDDVQVSDFDPTECLTSPEAIALFLDEAAATGDPKFLAHCLGVVAKAVGMGRVAGLAGVNRQALYRSLSGNMAPRMDTFMAVLKALGMRMRVDLTKAPPAGAA